MKDIIQKNQEMDRYTENILLPYPAIDISLPNHVSLHLVGSIHMGVPTMSPLSNVLINKIATADAVIVEADISTETQPFDQLSLLREPLEKASK